MYPNLYYLFKDLFGIELSFLKVFQMFGFLVAISFLLANYFFSKELKRKYEEGVLNKTIKRIVKGEKAPLSEYIGNALFGFVIGFKGVFILQDFEYFTNNTQDVILSLQGSWLWGIVAAGIMIYLKYRESEKNKLPEPKVEEIDFEPQHHVANMTMIAAIAGLLGAKIFHNLENWEAFWERPISNLLSFSGLTMYGGLICGSIAVLYYAHKQKLNIFHVMDACAPGLMLAYGTGRIGCHLSGDGDWGIVNTASKPGWMSFLPDWLWAYNYPNNVNRICNPFPDGSAEYIACKCSWEETPYLVQSVFPTPLYEAIVCILLFFVLWSLRKKIKPAGMLFSVYLLMNGVERFFIELIRVNTQYNILGGVTQAQLISTSLILIGLVGVFWSNKRHRIIS